MTTAQRVTLLVFLDSILVGISVISSYVIKYYGEITPAIWYEASISTLVSVVCLGACLYKFGLYHRVWRYASIGEIVSILRATVIGCIIAYCVGSLIVMQWMPWQVATRSFETTILLVGGARFVWRVYRDHYITEKQTAQRRALIVGAGDCGSIIVKELRNNPSSNQKPVAFIDDDPHKQKMQLHGLPVIGTRETIARTVESLHIDDIIIAMPSVSQRQIVDIIEVCKRTSAKLKIIPPLSHLFEGKVNIRSIRDVQVEDLLGRDPVNVDLKGITEYVKDRVVLVTGAGGSIGSELCRQLLFFKPSKLLLLGHGENSIYQIDNELSQLKMNIPVETIIADIQDKKRMQDIFTHYRPQVVFHAAAHKHVPLMEQNPSESIKNNVFGTKNVADCSVKFGVERFVLISSDKAVNPTSVMGVTKRIAEMIVQCMNVNSATKFTAVRFGNVLGSRGSVIPRFKDQIAKGGPVTVTHPEMVRYFMTIPEAVQLVIQAGAYAQGGEVFILDMGKPVKINTLAEDLIRFSGFEPHIDIKIEYTGIRPGEKLYEELLTEEEGLTTTKHDRIFIGKPTNLSRSELDFELKRLEQVLGEDQKVIRDLLKMIVPTYQNVS
ncbi:nucleoside-diphosphate sugar epimerase/dehydratase [Paenibacillus sp.]|uniref:polysaccharide biosynthesis protein n=1 Tax=Paenibacillus sp. TaxID=58172 RepID=UPI002D5C7BC7|nr:nucleoside-diphosphate sugar epimerase/dehydratase [Paenibacillus sp.]HZG86161.1 nucleoside-diphosphate sugar epimerase/dehydratase [Paenibacillus sp.]